MIYSKVLQKRYIKRDETQVQMLFILTSNTQTRIIKSI